MTRLAIDGGVPVRTDFLPYGHQWIDDEDVAACVEVLKSDWITQGPKVDEFEKKVLNTVELSMLWLSLTVRLPCMLLAPWPASQMATRQ